MNKLREFMKEEDGIGVVEIILILGNICTIKIRCTRC